MSKVILTVLAIAIVGLALKIAYEVGRYYKQRRNRK